jgi:N-acetylmuramoyl-L-alanine amidase
MSGRRWVEIGVGTLLVLIGVAIPSIIQHFEPPPANDVYYIVVHHAASGAGDKPLAEQESLDIDWREIDKMHRERGFEQIGYHYVVRLSGTVEKGRAEDLRGAHARAWDDRGISYNASSIGVCFAGNCDVAGWTLPQQASGYRLLHELMRRYGVPPERVIGHRETGLNTHCPGGKIDMDKVRARLRREWGRASGGVNGSL